MMAGNKVQQSFGVRFLTYLIQESLSQKQAVYLHYDYIHTCLILSGSLAVPSYTKQLDIVYNLYFDNYISTQNMINNTKKQQYIPL